MDTPEQLIAIYREEKRIGRKDREFWPDTDHATTDEYISFLKTVPEGSGLRGLVAQLAKALEPSTGSEYRQAHP